jgi:hypothetical protein
MAPAWKRTDFGLWLVHAGAVLSAVAVVAAVLATVLVEGATSGSVLVRLLSRLLPYMRMAILGGFLAAIVGALACAGGGGGGTARLLAASAAVALSGSVGLVLSSGGYARAIDLDATTPRAVGEVLLNALGWLLLLSYLALLGRAIARPAIAAGAVQCRRYATAAAAWHLGLLWLVRRLAEAEARGDDLDGIGTTVVVAGVGLAALSAAVVAWFLHLAVEARLALPDAETEPVASAPTPEAERPTPV